MATWVDRQHEKESWRAVGPSQCYSASCVELGRMVVDSLDALFDLGLPLPVEVLALHMEGMDGVMQRYVRWGPSVCAVWR
jgi:hypothetical protein